MRFTISLLLTLLTILVLSTASLRAQSLSDEATTIAQIKSWGGSVTRDEELPGRPVVGVTIVLAESYHDRRPHLSREHVQTVRSLKELRTLRVITYGFDVSLSPLKDLQKLESLELGYGRADLDFLEKLPHLTSLTVSEVLDQDLQQIAGAASLTTLHIGSGVVTGDGLRALQRLKKLTTLSLPEVPRNALSELEHLINLATLSIRGTLTSNDLAELKKVKSLDLLNLNSAVLPEGLDGLGEWPQLRTLYLGKANIKDSELRGLRGLRTLSLSGTTITDAAIQELGEFQNLQRLSLYDIPITDAVLLNFGELQSLRSLYLSRTQITGHDWAALKKLRNLEEITFTRLSGEVSQGLVDLKDLGELQGLVTLDLSGIQVTNAGLREIGKLQALKTLKLDSDKITDEGLVELSGLKNLGTLELRGSGITGKGLKDLKGLESLRTLDLSSSGGFRGADWQELKGLQNLTRIDLHNTRVTDSGLQGIGELQNLSELGLFKTRITDASLAEIGKLKQLTSLNVAENKITNQGLMKIAGLTNLIHLYLHFTDITDAGLQELTELKGLRRLTLKQYLNGSPRITERGCQELRKSLPSWEGDFH